MWDRLQTNSPTDGKNIVNNTNKTPQIHTSDCKTASIMTPCGKVRSLIQELEIAGVWV